LRPLVSSKRPTGYFTHIRNLVPACGPCNQSKSGQDWRAWLTGSARGSPKTRGITDLPYRIARLDAYERWSEHAPVNLSEIVGSERWNAYWRRLEQIELQMQQAQVEAANIRAIVASALSDARKTE
jgi:hypothetical protein